MNDEERADQGKPTAEGASGSGDSADPGLVAAVVERSRRALAEARPGSSVADPARDDHAEIIVPVAQPVRGTTNPGGLESSDHEAVSSRVSSEVRDGLIVAIAHGSSERNLGPRPWECGPCERAEGDVDRFLAAGWLPPSGPLPEWCCPACGETTRARLADKVPPLPEGPSPWDAYVKAYREYQETDPHGAAAHPTAHHMHALDAALRVYYPCPEHGDLLHRYVAASLEFDYTAEGDCGGEYDSDEQEHEAALANIAEMHRLLNLRAERLAEAHEKLRDQTSPLPDSETEWEWGCGTSLDEVFSFDEETARQYVETTGILRKRRKAGPWIEVPRG